MQVSNSYQSAAASPSFDLPAAAPPPTGYGQQQQQSDSLFDQVISSSYQQSPAASPSFSPGLTNSYQEPVQQAAPVANLYQVITKAFF